MKEFISKKRVLIGSIAFISLLLLILLNYKAYFIEEKFRYLFFILSILISFLSFLFFAIKINFNKKSNIIYTMVSIIMSIFFTYIIIELLNKNALFALYKKRLIFNFAVIILFHLLIYVITNRINLTIILSNFVVFILGVINYVVICFRGTPLVPWDFLSIKTAVHVASSYTFSFSYHFLLAITLLVFIISLALKVNCKPKKTKLNIIIRLAVLLIISSLVVTFFKTDMINYFDFENNLWKPNDEYRNNGFLASFLKQSKNLFNSSPNNYSIIEIENILSEFKNSDESIPVFNDNYIELSDKPNIIVIMSESYSDLTVNGDFGVSEEYMSYFYSLKENTIRGNTYVSVFGGQTPNSEWEFLTNNSMAFMPYRTVPYQQYIRRKSFSLATTLKAQGYTVNAIHPWYGSGYRRNAIYPLLGFDSFESLETLDNLEYLRKYPTDLSTYEHVIEDFKNKDKNEKLFDFVVTMQNHSGYDLEGYDSTIFLTDIENCPRVEQYLSVMKESDKALEYLIDFFKTYDEKTIILFFGDHQPPYFEDEFWQEIMEDPSNENTKYITPFILWANYDIEEQYIDKISLNYLSMLLLDTANLNTTPYIEFLRNIQKELPVITGNGYIDNSGIYHTFEEINQYMKLLKQYEIIQYNNVFDYRNRVDKFFTIN